MLQTKVHTLQTRVQELEETQSYMQQALAMVQASSSDSNSLPRDLIS